MYREYRDTVTTTCERWVQESPEHSYQVRCGAPARLVVIPDISHESAWWACEDHAHAVMANDHARIIVGARHGRGE